MTAKSMEQLAREMLARAGVPDAEFYTAGDLVEIANLIAARGPSQGFCPPLGREVFANECITAADWQKIINFGPPSQRRRE